MDFDGAAEGRQPGRKAIDGDALQPAAATSSRRDREGLE